jgi:hypothetical protein
MFSLFLLLTSIRLNYVVAAQLNLTLAFENSQNLLIGVLMMCLWKFFSVAAFFEVKNRMPV